MKRKKYAVPSAVMIIITTLIIGYSAVTRARTVAGHSWDEISPSVAVALDAETAGRIKKSGNNFSAWLDNNTGSSLVPAAAAGVVLGDNLIYHTGANADSTTRFGIASLTKTFTALLTLRLAEEGVLSLDDLVSKFLPQIVIERSELRSAPVTIRHLLNHTSGIPSSGKSKVYKIEKKQIGIPLQVNPAGYCYAYSNQGYELMQLIIEAAAGRQYSVCMKEKIFIPLNMNNSSAEHSNATGGIQSTIVDLAKYASMMINQGVYQGRVIISRESHRQLLAPGVDLPGVEIDYYYSMGWEVLTSKGLVESFYKAGRWYGESSAIEVYPRGKIAYIYLCNPPHHLNDSFMRWRQNLTGMLRALVRNISADSTLGGRWPSLKPDELKWYVGEYVKPLTGERVKVFFKGGRLYSDRYGVMPMRTFTSNRLLIDEGSMLHNFVWKDKRVIGLSLRDGYYERTNNRETGRVN